MVVAMAKPMRMYVRAYVLSFDLKTEQKKSAIFRSHSSVHAFHSYQRIIEISHALITWK